VYKCSREIRKEGLIRGRGAVTTSGNRNSLKSCLNCSASETATLSTLALLRHRQAPSHTLGASASRSGCTWKERFEGSEEVVPVSRRRSRLAGAASLDFAQCRPEVDDDASAGSISCSTSSRLCRSGRRKKVRLPKATPRSRISASNQADWRSPSSARPARDRRICSPDTGRHPFRSLARASPFRGVGHRPDHHPRPFAAPVPATDSERHGVARELQLCGLHDRHRGGCPEVLGS
jgi:hypothetical protein